MCCVLSPGLSFPICEMKPWLCFGSEAPLACALHQHEWKRGEGREAYS